MDNQTAKNKGIASLVLGIVSLILVIFIPYGGLIGIIAAIVGIVLGAQSRKELPEGENGIAIGGFVCSIVSLAVCAITLIACAICLGSIGAAGLLENL